MSIPIDMGLDKGCLGKFTWDKEGYLINFSKQLNFNTKMPLPQPDWRWFEVFEPTNNMSSQKRKEKDRKRERKKKNSKEITEQIPKRVIQENSILYLLADSQRDISHCSTLSLNLHKSINAWGKEVGAHPFKIQGIISCQILYYFWLKLGGVVKEWNGSRTWFCSLETCQW